MELQGFEGCDIPCEPGWQLQAADADCAEEDGGPIRQCTGVGSIGQVVQLKHLPCQALRRHRRRETTSQHLRDLSGVANRQKMEFHGGSYKDLQRHAFSEVTVAAPLPAETPSIPLTMSSGDG